MKKHRLLYRLEKTARGNFVAWFYDTNSYFGGDKITFIDYSRREVINILRSKYNVIVPNEYRRAG